MTKYDLTKILYHETVEQFLISNYRTNSSELVYESKILNN